MREVIKAVKEVSGVDFNTVEASRRPGDPATLVARADQIRTVFAWQPKHDKLTAIVEDAWQWEKNLVP